MVLRRTGKRLSNLGRRTGLDIRAGKRIGVDQNGLECFDDYWTSSDESCSEQEDDRPSPKCSSPAYLNASRMSSFIKCQTPRKELPEKISFVRKPTLRSHVQEKQLQESEGFKANKRKLLVKGRRTGKEIQVIDGIENFDNYWSDSSSAWTSVQSGELSSNIASSRKYSSVEKVANVHQETVVQEPDSEPSSEFQSPASSDAVSEPLSPRAMRYASRSKNNETLPFDRDGTVVKQQSSRGILKTSTHNVTRLASSPRIRDRDENSVIVALEKSPRTHRGTPKKVEAVNSPGEDAEQSWKMRAVERRMTLVGDVSTQTHYDSLLGQKMTGVLADVAPKPHKKQGRKKKPPAVASTAAQENGENVIEPESGEGQLTATQTHYDSLLGQKMTGVLAEGAPKPHKKRGRKKKPPAVASTAAQENSENVIEGESGEGQLRRSTRTRFPPLETWRGEHLRIKYENGQIAKVELVEGREPDNSSYDRIRRDIEMRERRKKEKEKVPKRVKLQENSMNLKKIKKDINKVEVLDPKTGDEELVYLHRPHDTLLWTVPPQRDKDDASYTITKCFSGELISFGFIEIGIGKKKKEQHSPEYNIAFNVVKGNHIKIRIHKTSLYLKELDYVVVPAGNVYSMHNKGKSVALLNFSTFKAPMFDYQFPNNGEDNMAEE